MNTLRTLFAFSIFFLLNQSVQAAKIDTVDTYSSPMKKTIKAVVVTPDSYSGGKELPVLYLLHGYGGSYSDWAKNVAHDYITRPGGHNWNYWTNSLNYQLLFMRQYFDKSKSK